MYPFKEFRPSLTSLSIDDLHSTVSLKSLFEDARNRQFIIIVHLLVETLRGGLSV